MQIKRFYFRPCEHHCRNLPDRYECYCASGYELDEDNRQCNRSRNFYSSMVEQSRRRQLGKSVQVATQDKTTKAPYTQRRYNQGYYTNRYYQRRAPHQPHYRYNTSNRQSRPTVRNSHTYQSHSPATRQFYR